MYNIPNIAIFGTIAKNAVIIEGDPSYTSGAHIWNGAAANLNNTATNINIAPTDNPILSLAFCANHINVAKP